MYETIIFFLGAAAAISFRAILLERRRKRSYKPLAVVDCTYLKQKNRRVI